VYTEENRIFLKNTTMTIRYRIKFETYYDLEPNITIKSKEVMDEVLAKPTNSLNYGMGQEKQIELRKCN